MKLEIYEPHYVGYVSLNPYEWEYNGRYPEISRILDRNSIITKSDSFETDDGKIVEVENEIEDEEEILRRISFNLLSGKIWHTEIVDE